MLLRDWFVLAGWLKPDVTREAICPSCLAAFTQRQLCQEKIDSARFNFTSRWAQPRDSIPAIDRDCPDGWVPLHCPKCEHAQLGIDARASERPLEPRSPAKASPATQRALDVRYEQEEREGMAAS